MKREKTLCGGRFFDEDHDFNRGSHRSPKAHLDTVLTKPVAPPGQAPYGRPPEIRVYGCFLCSLYSTLKVFMNLMMPDLFVAGTLSPLSSSRPTSA
jgi:hypothetical protein